MLVDTRNLVSAQKFKRDLNQFIDAAKEGNGPVAVTQDSEIVGFFVSAKQYESLYESEVSELIQSRMNEATISHEEVKQRLAKRFKRRAKS